MRLRSILVLAVLMLGLGTVFLLSNRRQQVTVVEPRAAVWTVAAGDLRKLAISLPAVGKRESWTMHDDEYWYFDEPNGPKVDMARWGGGIPLLLSGPFANRLIADKATDEQLEAFGLAKARMAIRLALKNGDVIEIEVGDRSPDHQAYYLRLAGSRTVYTVDYVWCDVLEKLVQDPPYPDAGKK